MPFSGTLINVAAIVIAGILGKSFGRLLPDRIEKTLVVTCGLSTIVLGLAGSIAEMLKIGNDGSFSTGKGLELILMLAGGSLVGEILNIDDRLTAFGEWLKQKSGNENDQGFVSAFVNTTAIVGIGAMAITGAIEDGIMHKNTILVNKSILDFIMVFAMTGGQGIGCMFSAIPVGIFEFLLTLLASFLTPVINAAALSYITLTGSTLILAVGLNIVFEKNIRVMNMLPSIVIAVLWAKWGAV